MLYLMVTILNVVKLLLKLLHRGCVRVCVFNERLEEQMRELALL